MYNYHVGRLPKFNHEIEWKLNFLESEGDGVGESYYVLSLVRQRLCMLYLFFLNIIGQSWSGLWLRWNRDHQKWQWYKNSPLLPFMNSTTNSPTIQWSEGIIWLGTLFRNKATKASICWKFLQSRLRRAMTNLINEKIGWWIGLMT